MRWLVLSIGAALVWVGVAAASAPTLLTASSSDGHIVVTFSAGDLVPGQIAVATRPAHTAGGAFVQANVKLHERIVAETDAATGNVRFRTHAALPKGTYYVAVSGFLQDPPVSCTPIRSRCAERWSNVLRVAVRPASVP